MPARGDNGSVIVVDSRALATRTGTEMTPALRMLRLAHDCQYDPSDNEAKLGHERFIDQNIGIDQVPAIVHPYIYGAVTVRDARRVVQKHGIKYIGSIKAML